MTPNRRRLTVAVLALLSCSAAAAEVRITSAWVRAMPPTQRMTAGYAELTNTGDHAVTISGATSPIAAVASLHTTVTEGAQRRMAALPSVTLAPGESFQFAPNGPHVMLMGMKRMPSVGERVRLCFTTDEDKPLCANAAVSRDRPPSE